MSLNTYDKDLKQKILVDGTDEVDSALSATSTNPVENRVITEELTTRDAEISDMNNILGAKNLLPLTSVSQLYNGVTYTVNSDGSITANGKATGGPSYFWFHGNVTIENKYKGMLVSGATGGDTNTYGIFINLYPTLSGGVTANYSQTNDDFTIPNDDNNGIKLGIYVREGITVSNQVFYPMIRPASIADGTYVPYAMTNYELTKNRISNTEITNWTRSSSYPSGTAIPSGAWTTIAYKSLPAGLWFINVVVNMTNDVENAMYQRIFIGDGSDAHTIISDSITCKQRNVPLSTIVYIPTATTVYLQVYSNATSKVYAHLCSARKLGN